MTTTIPNVPVPSRRSTRQGRSWLGWAAVAVALVVAVALAFAVLTDGGTNATPSRSLDGQTVTEFNERNGTSINEYRGRGAEGQAPATVADTRGDYDSIIDQGNISAIERRHTAG